MSGALEMLVEGKDGDLVAAEGHVDFDAVNVVFYAEAPEGAMLLLESATAIHCPEGGQEPFGPLWCWHVPAPLLLEAKEWTARLLAGGELVASCTFETFDRARAAAIVSAPDDARASFARELHARGLVVRAETLAGLRDMAGTPACDVARLLVQCRVEGAEVRHGVVEGLEPVFELLDPQGVRYSLPATVVREKGASVAELQGVFSGPCAPGKWSASLVVAGITLASTLARAPGGQDVLDDLQVSAVRFDAIGADTGGRVFLLEKPGGLAVRIALAPVRYSLTAGYPVRVALQLLDDAGRTLATTPITLDPDARTGSYRTREPLVVARPESEGAFTIRLVLPPRVLAEEVFSVLSVHAITEAAKIFDPALVLLGPTKDSTITTQANRADLEGKLVVKFRLDTSHCFVPGTVLPFFALLANDAGEVVAQGEATLEVHHPTDESVLLALPLAGVAARLTDGFRVHVLLVGREVFARRVEIDPPPVTFNGEGAIVGGLPRVVSDEAFAEALGFFAPPPEPRRRARRARRA